MVGTNNAINVNSQGTVYFDGNGNFSGIDGSTSGFLLTSNGTGVAPSFQSGAGSVGITQINGDSGSVTGSTITLYSHLSLASSYCGSSVSFVNSGTVSTMNVTDASFNTIIGAAAGNLTLTGSNNTALGHRALTALTSGTGIVAVGTASGFSETNGTYNVGLGAGSYTDHSGSYTLVIGNGATSSSAITSSIGFQTFIGHAIGFNNRLVIGAGTGTTQQLLNSTYIYGISGQTLTAPLQVSIATGSDQIKTGVFTQYSVVTGGASNAINLVAPGAAGTVLTSNGAAIQPSFILGAYGTRTASVFGTSASPTGTTSTVSKMMGLGSSWTITPLNYTKIKAVITGQMTNNTTGDGVQIKISRGTGAAPANGDAAAGTLVGNTTGWTALTGLLTNGVPFKKSVIITGLVTGTTYWIDLQVAAVTGGTASVLNLDFSAQELQY